MTTDAFSAKRSIVFHRIEKHLVPQLGKIYRTAEKSVSSGRPFAALHLI
jgi:hypothetical protein